MPAPTCGLAVQAVHQAQLVCLGARQAPKGFCHHSIQAEGHPAASLAGQPRGLVQGDEIGVVVQQGGLQARHPLPPRPLLRRRQRPPRLALCAEMLLGAAPVLVSSHRCLGQ